MALYSNQVGQIPPPPGCMLEFKTELPKQSPKKLSNRNNFLNTIFSSTNCHLNWFPFSQFTLLFPNKWVYTYGSAVEKFFCKFEKVKTPDLQDSIKICFVKFLGSII